MSAEYSSTAGLQDLTECPICYERFERPLQLSCGHSYCGKCVNKLCTVSPQSHFGGTNDEYEVECPECRRITRVPPGGLPLNYRLQDLIAHVSSEGVGGHNSSRNEAEEKCSPKCLVCGQSIDKGIYMSCHTCAYEHENMSQMCSLCCLRSHNGHEIVEKPFLYDINVLVDSVSESTCHGLDAVYEALNELDAFAASAKSVVENNTRGVLYEFEVIASDVQREGIAAQGKLERKIETARKISEELKKLPCYIKEILTDTRKTLELSSSEFVDLIKKKIDSASAEALMNREPPKSSNHDGDSAHDLNTSAASWKNASSHTLSATTNDNATSVSTEVLRIKSSRPIQENTRIHTREEKTAVQSRIPKKTSKQNRGTTVNTAANSASQDLAVKGPDWNGLQSKIRTYFRDASPKSGASSVAVLMTPAQKGHLLYNCNDGCLKNLSLSDIGGCQFPDIISKENINSLWNAWIAVDIFSRTDLDVKTKLKWYKDQRCRGLRSGSLKLVLKTAYQRCADWRDFITNTDKVANHPTMGGFYFVSTYNRVLRELREELREETFRNIPQKLGPVGYIAGVSTPVEEHDVIAGVVITTAATSFVKVVELLQEWNTYSTWIITWPFDEKVDEDTCRKLLLALKSYIEDGGKVISAWPPITKENATRWRGMASLWKFLDETISQFKLFNQVFITASNMYHNGKVLVEVGSPECSAQYYSSHEHASSARQAYEAIRNRAQDAQLPCLNN